MGVVQRGVVPRGRRKGGGGGPTIATRERRSRVMALWRCSIEQGSGGR
jgi:hypothetical protein